MTAYRRLKTPGASWFFSVKLADRQGNRLLVAQIHALRTAFRAVRSRDPRQIEAIVVLPDRSITLWREAFIRWTGVAWMFDWTPGSKVRLD